MTKWKGFGPHRTWEDWLGMALGIVIAVAPWVVKETDNQPAVLNAVVSGFAVMMLAELELVHFRRWTEIGLLVLGCWVAASSLAFGYAAEGTMRFWHLGAGLLVTSLAALEMWQQKNGS